MNHKEYLEEKLNKLPLPVKVNGTQLEQFLQFYEMLVEKNKVMNLTGITEFSDVVEKHFMDSLAFVPERTEGTKLIDVGTGAGFPGIPLKILYPELQITLMDSLKKRLNFLDEVIAALGLEKIETLHGRAEDLGHQAVYREQYDYCVSRAVANLTTLSEYCLPFVKVGGVFVSYKSGSVEEEQKDAERGIQILSGKIEKVDKFQIVGTDLDRSLVWIRKEGKLKGKYPRKAGTPSREPLH